MKKCKKCEESKDLLEFYKSKNHADGYLNKCKSCLSIEYKEKYELNKEEIKRKIYERRINNPERHKEISKKGYHKHREKNKIREKEWRENNPERVKEYNKNYIIENKDILNIKRKEYLEKNQDKFKEYFHNYNKINFDKRKKQREDRKDIIKKYNYEYKKFRYENDEMYRTKCNVSKLIYSSLKSRGYKKNSSTYEILGCSYEEFRLHIESKFEDWMSWDNKSNFNGELNTGWDYDHIIPLSSAETFEDVLKLNHYSNLQPLCSYVNRYIKRNRLDYNL